MTSVGNDSGSRPAWLSPGARAPARYVDIDDRTTAAAALAQVRGGAALIYRGDYRNARQLLAAMGRRLAGRSASRRERQRPAGALPGGAAQHRQEHETLSRLAVPIEAGPAGRGWRSRERPGRGGRAHRGARRAGLHLPGALPLRDLLGMVGAHEWRSKGVEVPSLGAHLRTALGRLRAGAGRARRARRRGGSKRWPVAGKRALDVGTGTGVLALLLARAGAQVTATDLSPAAVACARENASRLAARRPDRGGRGGSLRGGAVRRRGLQPAVAAARGGDAARPGGLRPGRPRSWPASSAGWRPTSRPAARGGSSSRTWRSGSGCAPRGSWSGSSRRPASTVAGGLEAAPRHPRSRDRDDPLHEARSQEVTALRRLVGGGGRPSPG